MPKTSFISFQVSFISIHPVLIYFRHFNKYISFNFASERRKINTYLKRHKNNSNEVDSNWPFTVCP